MDTLEILRQCTVMGNNVKLPNVLLDYQTEYKPLKKKLEDIGGKWVGGKVEAFVFDSDPTELLNGLQEGQQINLKQDYQFFATPEKLGMYMIGLSPISLTTPNIKVLEPSAGDGELIKCIQQIAQDLIVDCFELMEQNKLKLQKLQKIRFLGNDFIKAVELDKLNLFRNQYDLIIANPPFSKNQDIDHILAMFKCLKIGGSLVTVASKSWFIGSQKKQVEFKEWLKLVGAKVEEVEEGTFKGSGTLVGTMIISLTKKLEQEANLFSENEAPEKIETKYQGFKGLKNTEEENKSPEEILEDIEESMSEATNIFKDLKQLIKPEVEMQFFNQLSTLLGEAEISFTIKKKNDEITVMILPKTVKDIRPIILYGTAEDLDTEFFQHIESPLRRIGGLKTNISEEEEEKVEKPKRRSPTKKEELKAEPISETKPEAATEEEKPKEGPTAEQLAQEEEDRKAAEEEALRKEEEEKAKAEEEAKKQAEEKRLKELAGIQESAHLLGEEGKYKEAVDLLKSSREIATEEELPAINEKIKALIQKRVEAEMLD